MLALRTKSGFCNILIETHEQTRYSRGKLTWNASSFNSMENSPRQYLYNTLPNRWIRRFGPVPWPARSRNLKTLDFCLWGHMKGLIYETPVESEMDLVGKIMHGDGLIADTPRVFDCVWESPVHRYQTCIDVQGRHFDQLL